MHSDSKFLVRIFRSGQTSIPRVDGLVADLSVKGKALICPQTGSGSHCIGQIEVTG